MIKILHKTQSKYSIELLANLLANIELEKDVTDLHGEEFEFSDAVVFVSGSIRLMENSILPDFSGVIVSFNNESIKYLTLTEVLELEKQTKNNY